MSRNKKSVEREYTHIVYDGYDNDLDKFHSLESAIEHLRERAQDEGADIDDFITDHDVEIFEIKQILKVNEKVTRTITVNGVVLDI